MKRRAQPFHFDVLYCPRGHTGLVRIVLRNVTEVDGRMAVTEELTVAEIDNKVQALKDELDEIAAKGKAIAQ